MKGFGIIFAVISIMVLAAGCGSKKSEIPVGEIMANATVSNAQDTMGTEGATLEASAPAAMPPAMEAMANAPYVAPTAREIQAALKNAGYYKGAVDGKLGPKSKKAIEAFQNDNGLTGDGKVGPKTWTKLQTYLNKTTEPAAMNSQAIAD
jgi:peptidoglycan hydrolase-like protein with peptidoglycan-binding domain